METENESGMEVEAEPIQPSPAVSYPRLPTVEDDDDWIYVNRRRMQEIVPGLFLGPYASATRNSLERMLAAVKTVSTFIDGCLANGGKVLVHGNAGMSRSAALVVGYIMSKYGVNYKTARKYVQSKRFCISINESFANQLKEYEPIYKAVHMMRSRSTSGVDDQYHVIKRKIDELAEDEEDEMETNMSNGNRRKMNEENSEDELMEV